MSAVQEVVTAAPAIDAIFVSCTSLRVAEAAERLEERTCVPITSSNHAMAWHCLRLAGIEDVVSAAGKLYELPSR